MSNKYTTLIEDDGPSAPSAPPPQDIVVSIGHIDPRVAAASPYRPSQSSSYSLQNIPTYGGSPVRTFVPIQGLAGAGVIPGQQQHTPANPMMYSIGAPTILLTMPSRLDISKFATLFGILVGITILFIAECVLLTNSDSDVAFTVYLWFWVGLYSVTIFTRMTSYELSYARMTSIDVVKSTLCWRDAWFLFPRTRFTSWHDSLMFRTDECGSSMEFSPTQLTEILAALQRTTAGNKINYANQ